MYDHLDGDVPLPDDEVREAVHDRAAVLRRRRRLAAASAGTSIALAGVLVAVNLTGAPARKATLVLNDPTPTVTVTVTATAEPTPEPTPEPTVTASASPAPVGTAPSSDDPPPEPSTSATPPSGCEAQMPSFPVCPDGKPGWSTGFTWCANATAADVPKAAPTDELFDGVTVTFVLPSSTVRAGTRLAGVLRFSSTRRDRVVLDITEPQSALFGQGRGGAKHGDDAVEVRRIELAPGETRELDLGVLAASCGDGYEDPDIPLPPGAYAAGSEIYFGASPVESASPSPSAGPVAPTSSGSPSPEATDGPIPANGTFAVRVDVTVV